jgi:DNA polymerase III epsilon subunit-like protein
MSHFIVDVEADNKTPASGSMVCFGVVLVSDTDKTFYGETKPITDTFNPEALAVSGFTREEHEKFEDPETVMRRFAEWVKEVNVENRPIFLSDNNGFDWMWIAYYFDKYGIENPFGHSSRRIGDIYCGLVGHAGKNRDWKRMRKTKHDHNPVNDSKGNVEAFRTFVKKYNFKIRF